MITFKQFISEGERTAAISAEEAISQLKQHCGKYLAGMKAGEGNREKIWRGIPRDAGIYAGNSEQLRPRTSRNTYNYYTLWIDNNPAWADFPKRSQSFICSESKSYASGYADGSLAWVIPFDTAKIGVVPGQDIWDVFDFPDGERMDGFMDSVAAVFDHFGQGNPSTYQKLVASLKYVTAERVNEIDEDPHADKPIEGYYLATLKDMLKGRENLYQTFIEIFKPDDFEHTTAAHFNGSNAKGRELFIQGKVIFIPTRLDYLDKEEVEKLANFFYQYHLTL